MEARRKSERLKMPSKHKFDDFQPAAGCAANVEGQPEKKTPKMSRRSKSAAEEPVPEKPKYHPEMFKGYIQGKERDRGHSVCDIPAIEEAEERMSGKKQQQHIDSDAESSSQKMASASVKKSLVKQGKEVPKGTRAKDEPKGWVVQSTKTVDETKMSSTSNGKLKSSPTDLMDFTTESMSSESEDEVVSKRPKKFPKYQWFLDDSYRTSGDESIPQDDDGPVDGSLVDASKETENSTPDASMKETSAHLFDHEETDVENFTTEVPKQKGGGRQWKKISQPIVSSDSDEDGKIDLYHQTKSASLKVKNRALQLQSLQSTQMEEPVISTESDGSNLQRRQKVKLASTSSNEKERTRRPKLKNMKEETLSLGSDEDGLLKGKDNKITPTSSKIKQGGHRRQSLERDKMEKAASGKEQEEQRDRIEKKSKPSCEPKNKPLRLQSFLLTKLKKKHNSIESDEDELSGRQESKSNPALSKIPHQFLSPETMKMNQEAAITSGSGKDGKRGRQENRTKLASSKKGSHFQTLESININEEDALSSGTDEDDEEGERNWDRLKKIEKELRRHIRKAAKMKEKTQSTGSGEDGQHGNQKSKIISASSKIKEKSIFMGHDDEEDFNDGGNRKKSCSRSLFRERKPLSTINQSSDSECEQRYYSQKSGNNSSVNKPSSFYDEMTHKLMQKEKKKLEKIKINVPEMSPKGMTAALMGLRFDVNHHMGDKRVLLDESTQSTLEKVSAMQLWPILEDDELKVVERKLRCDRRFRENMVDQFLKKKSEGHPVATIHSIMDMAFGIHLARQYTLLGRRNQKNFSDLQLYLYVKVAAQTAFPALTDPEVEQAVSRWLTCAKDPRKDKVLEKQASVYVQRVRDAQKAAKKH